MVLLYMVTFTINISQMLAYIYIYIYTSTMDPSWVDSLIITNSQRKSPNLSKSLPAEDGSVPPEIVRDQDTKRNPTVEWSHQLQW